MRKKALRNGFTMILDQSKVKGRPSFRAVAYAHKTDLLPIWEGPDRATRQSAANDIYAWRLGKVGGDVPSVSAQTAAHSVWAQGQGQTRKAGSHKSQA